MATKYCKWCGEAIDADCVVCPRCGKQVEELKQSSQPIVINNTNTASAVANASIRGGGGGRARNKWTAFFLCLFLGYLGAHKFYEGRTGKGLLYLITLGLFGIGWIVDTVVLLFKPNPYYV